MATGATLGSTVYWGMVSGLCYGCCERLSCLSGVIIPIRAKKQIHKGLNFWFWRKFSPARRTGENRGSSSGPARQLQPTYRNPLLDQLSRAQIFSGQALARLTANRPNRRHRTCQLTGAYPCAP
ncbi:uncharacterized protein METZ01_LOCUS340434 [marine metagenome]|uniref:Uncharacterized protein n=1 Tax=marine metagenome TaxID=408172 RepID=A0A382QRQ8_9ZZZZ